MKKLTLKAVKQIANDNQKSVTFNCALAGYQVISAFGSSEVVVPARDEKGRIVLTQLELKTLLSYI